jgi:hypothetical protein
MTVAPGCEAAELSAPALDQVAQAAWELAPYITPPVDVDRWLSDERLLEFWSTTRSLADEWLQRLAAEPPVADPEHWFDCRPVAAEIVVIDMLVRVTATILASWEQTLSTTSSTPRAAARPVLDRAVDYIAHARRRWMEQLLADETDGAAEDRLRRRGERWTDLLIGPWLVRTGVSQYAHDARRAWDFGEEALAEPTSLAQRFYRHSFVRAFEPDLHPHRMHSQPGLLLWQHLRTLLAGLHPHAVALQSAAEPGLSPWQVDLAEALGLSDSIRLEPASSPDLLEASLRRLLGRDSTDLQ